MRPGRYVSGSEFAETGLAELVDVVALARATHDAPGRDT
jgi:hypothetical protein